MESEHQPAQQSIQSTMQGLVYGAAFVNHCMHPQLQQLADVQWRFELTAKLAAILEKLRERFSTSQNVCLCQTWVGADGCETSPPNNLEVTLWADPRLAIVLDPLFEDLRSKSCQGPVFFRNSMPGKVWRSGAVQIVQNLRILPPSLHPRSQLSEEALERLAEALYIPIYDLSRPARGQVCVLEVLLSTRATEAMLVADVISFIGSLLTALHLSLANPVQQPVRRSVLSGRRPRAPESDGEASGDEGANELSRQHQKVGGGPQSRQAQESGPGPKHYSGRSSQGPGGSGTGAGANVKGSPCAGLCDDSASDVSKGGAATTACGKCSGEVHEEEAAAGTTSAGVATATDAAARTGPIAGIGRGVCGRGPPGAIPACSEQPTLPASPSRERLARAADARNVTASISGGAALGQESGSGYCSPGMGGHTSVPRKVRKVLDGPMQRTKSVAALSQGAMDSEDEGDGAGVRQASLKGRVPLALGPGETATK